LGLKKKEMGEPLMAFASEHELERASLLSLQEKKVPLNTQVWAEHWSSIVFRP